MGTKQKSAEVIVYPSIDIFVPKAGVKLYNTNLILLDKAEINNVLHRQCCTV